MDEPLHVYKVIVTGINVDLVRIEPDHPGYNDAREHAILRDRSGINLVHQQQVDHTSREGEHSFLSLDNARSFALLQLKVIEDEIEANFDRIQSFSD